VDFVIEPRPFARIANLAGRNSHTLPCWKRSKEIATGRNGREREMLGFQTSKRANSFVYQRFSRHITWRRQATAESVFRMRAR